MPYLRVQPSISRRALVFGAGYAGMAAALDRAYAASGPRSAFSTHAGDDAADADHGSWTGLLQRFVTGAPDGVARVDYRSFLSQGRADLSRYLDLLQSIDVRSLSRAGQVAYWSNLYNAKTVDIVLSHYPVKSIRDIDLGGGLLAVFSGGPWSAKLVRVAGWDLSLDDIEHEILRPIFKDARIHYALNCASIGCPNLGQSALTAATLEPTLDRAAAAYVNHPRGVQLDHAGLTVSSIYDWFAEDFGDGVPGVLRHIRRYASAELRRTLSAATGIAGYAYDWSLNDV